MKEKECTGCKQKKPLDAFCRSSKNKVDGRALRCKSCVNERRAKRRREQGIKPQRGRLQGKEERKKRFIGENSRECTICGKILPYSDFRVNSTSSTGYSSGCKSCYNVLGNERRYKASGKRPKYHDGESKECSKCGVIQSLESFPKSSRKKDGRGASCKTCESVRISAAHKKNPGKRSISSSLRYAERKLRAVEWANYDLISDFYRMRCLLSEWLGEEFHVDHVIPISGKCKFTGKPIVSGLHVHQNLRLVRATENMSKNDKFIPELVGQFD